MVNGLLADNDEMDIFQFLESAECAGTKLDICVFLKMVTAQGN